MFILAVIDAAQEQQHIARLLAAEGHQVDFITSGEDIAGLCRQTEPDALVMAARYADVTARFLLKQLYAGAADALPERILVVAEPAEAGADLTLSPGLTARWVRPQNLPAALGDPAWEEPEAEAGPKRILHISDDRLLQRIIRDLIRQKTPYSLFSASDGAEGLTAYQDFHPHLILTDWDLPDTDGIALCRRIKVDLKDSAVAVVLFSSMTDEKLIESAYEAHAKAYIQKPVRPELLLNKINRILEAQ